MKQNRVHGGQAKQFSCDDVARIVASAVNKVLSELKVQYIVEGTAVFSAENSFFWSISSYVIFRHKRPGAFLSQFLPLRRLLMDTTNWSKQYD